MTHIFHMLTYYIGTLCAVFFQHSTSSLENSVDPDQLASSEAS